MNSHESLSPGVAPVCETGRALLPWRAFTRFKKGLSFVAVLTLGLASAASAAESLFPASNTGNVFDTENTYYELGTIFRPTVAGTVTHLRVYALSSELGAHTARLWRNSTNTLIGGPYSWTYGGTTGWITLDIPDVAIAANTDYTVVVSTGATNGSGKRPYPVRVGDLSLAGGNGANLTHPANAGVFTTIPGVRPLSNFSGSNYYRDIVFVRSPPEPPADAPVRINEFVADNQSGLTDEDGDTSDWIELYNPKGTAVDITGYQLTSGITTWTFPATSIGAQSFVVVFASAKNRATLPLHTNFKLSAAGEYLALRDGTGALIGEFAPAFPAQRKDVSYGRGSAGNTGFMTTPTPADFNATAYDDFVADTVFSVKRGFFTAPIQVAINTLTAGATIRYTLNGATPTATSPAYTAPLTFSATTTLRARAFKTNFVPTNTDTNTYIFVADLPAQTNASTRAYGWPAGPVNGQTLRYGMNPDTLALSTPSQQINALTQVPTLSIVTDQPSLTGAASGVYVNAATAGLEQASSVEQINPDQSPGFQIDAGLRIRGGQSRAGNFPKHSFNFFFRSEYGTGQLNFPLFGAEGAQKFDTLSLRCEHGTAYADPYGINYRQQYTLVRDITCRELWGATGYESTRSRYYHLLLNGQYWGLYQTEERAQEDFGATYFGGSSSEYDAIAATGIPQLVTELAAGDLTAWTQLWSGTRAVNGNPSSANYFALLGKNADGTRNPALPVLLDPQELAAYMLLHYYTGHGDEPLSVSFNYEKPNNFRAVRRRGLDAPWHFFVHDGESSLAGGDWVNNRANAVNLTSPNRNDITYSNPEWMHEDLLANPEYRIAFADAAQRLLFNGGAFTSGPSLAIWNALAARIDQAVIGESIRWAQTAGENQTVWAAEVDRVRTQFFPTRSATVLGQLRQTAWRGFALFPSVDAPVFSQRGGQVAAGFQLTLSAAAGGTIYYSLDGSDPRSIGGGIAGTSYTGAITIGAPTLVRARFHSNAGEWSALDEAFFTTFPPAVAGKLIVSKVHYHPLPPSTAELSAGFNSANDFEYLEFQNISTETLDLRGVKVDAGVTFGFATAAIISLAPGARVCIVENSAAFAMRYGSGLPVAGAFMGNLSDGGEQVRVLDGTGALIALFSYDDIAPWPLTPDGDGPALVLRASNLYAGDGLSWRASYSTGGKPGALDVLTLADWRSQHFTAADLADPAKESTVWGLLADPDRNGFSNALEYALGGLPAGSPSPSAVSTALFAASPAAHYLRASYRVREGTTGVTITPEVSNDLVSWSSGTTVIDGPVSQGDGSAIITVQDNTALEFVPAGRRFFRIKVTFP